MMRILVLDKVVGPALIKRYYLKLKLFDLSVFSLSSFPSLLDDKTTFQRRK